MKLHSLAFILFAAILSFAAPTIYEAENETGVLPETILDSAGVSGGKYVQTTSMTFNVTVEQAGYYDFFALIWVKQYDWFNTVASVNEKEILSVTTNSPSDPYTAYELKWKAKLNEGKNVIELSGGTLNVDYLSVEKYSAPEFQLTKEPVTKGATESAKKILSFLVDNFQKKTVSGMMIGDNAFNYDYANMKLIETCVPEDSCSFTDEQTQFLGQEDIRLFKEKTGYNPALGGFDFLFATGGHSDEGWFLGYTENSIRMAKELFSLGGIPAFTWHWKVGQDTVFYTKAKGFNNAACTEGVIASSADNTCFNYTKAFKDNSCKELDETSETYKLLAEDIDKVSALFLKLQEENVAALFRPLHEAAGGWFWWGTSTPECYTALYKFVYDRMTNTNGVKNLLWVWNIERDPNIGYDVHALNGAWYPGDAFVDIVGVDIYNSANDNQSNAAYFSKITEEVGVNKILALTENGPIPDVDSMATDESVWSFWMPWYNTWGSGFLNQTSDAVWQKNLADERIIKLENMPGWDTYAKVEKHLIQNRDVSLTIKGVSLSVYTPRNYKASVHLFDVQGNKVKTFHAGNLNAGTHLFSLNALNQGVYIFQIKGEGINYTKQIVVK